MYTVLSCEPISIRQNACSEMLMAYKMKILRLFFLEDDEHRASPTMAAAEDG